MAIPTLLATLLAGFGLFLLGMRLLTEGLQVAAGQSLKQILGSWTSTPFRGLLTGGLLTGLVQSSSAVTVATIGFVNAGLIDLARALAVVFGSNVGTTMTSWIVVLLGVKVQVGAFAGPLVGAGGLLRLSGARSRRAPLGDAIAGLGLFFLGIELLREAFAGLGAGLEPGAWARPGVAGLLLSVAIGFALTVLAQSSSAAMTVMLTATAGGVMPLESAAAGAIGTNLGTTSTAALAAIGATPNARRVAAGHVLFNALAAIAALSTLPLLLAAIDGLREMLGLEKGPLTAIALFHTAFNVLGVLLIWPWRTRLVRFLEARFRSAEEDESVPRFLDRNVVGTPGLALAALIAELEHVASLAARMARAALVRGERAIAGLELQGAALHALSRAISTFVADLGRAGLPAGLESAPGLALEAARHWLRSAVLALELARSHPTPPASKSVVEALAACELRLQAAIDAAEPPGGDLVESGETPQGEFTGLAATGEPASGGEAPGEEAASEASGAPIVSPTAAVEAAYAAAKAELLAVASRGELDVDVLGALLDRIWTVRELAREIEKGTQSVDGLRGLG